MNHKIEHEANSLLNLIVCTSLPVDTYEIALRCGYNVRNYHSGNELIDRLGLSEYASEHQAFSFTYENTYYIFLSNDLTKDDERKMIAHEIGHIRLHDLNINSVFGHSEDEVTNARYEFEADEFALHLLAPLPILANYKIKSAANIKELTGLSLSDCCKVYDKLLNYRDECCIIYERNRLQNRSHNRSHRFDTFLKLAFLILSALVFCILSLHVFIIKHTDTQNTDISEPSQNASQSGINDSSLELDHDATYYWTESGTVFHIHQDCRSLKNSTEIRSGTLSQAQTEKPRLCKFCEDNLH